MATDSSNMEEADNDYEEIPLEALYVNEKDVSALAKKKAKCSERTRATAGGATTDGDLILVGQTKYSTNTAVGGPVQGETERETELPQETAPHGEDARHRHSTSDPQHTYESLRAPRGVIFTGSGLRASPGTVVCVVVALVLVAGTSSLLTFYLGVGDIADNAVKADVLDAYLYATHAALSVSAIITHTGENLPSETSSYLFTAAVNIKGAPPVFSYSYIKDFPKMGGSQTLSYTHEEVNSGGLALRYTGVIKKKGLYMFCVSAEAQETGISKMKISGQFDDVYRFTTYGHYNTFGVDFAMYLAPGDHVHMLGGRVRDSPAYKLSSWSGFSVTGTMEPGIGFMFYTESISTHEQGRVVFTETLYNTESWEDSNSGFTTPQAGVYVVGFNALERWGNCYVRVDNQTMFSWKKKASHHYSNFISRLGLLSLDSSSDISFHTDADTFIGRVTFFGFLYSPAHGAPVAWSVHRSTHFHGHQPNAEPFSYDYITANTGAFSRTTSKVTTPVSGYYYLSFSAGVVGTRRCLLFLKVNGENRAGLRKQLRSSDADHVTLTRSVILSLSAGDVVHIWASAAPTYHVLSDTDHQTSFSGFLIAVV